ncbi:MAG TPA: metallophosphoesterase, partial [Chloroflexota bacterium]|nr:metallophosphoesterase [Chloroflexota bacterium]
MRCSFVHFGDVHLGTQQYDCYERLLDFGKAWTWACEYIANARPDFAVCTGDLFNRFTINPITFEHAIAGLSMLRDAGVPIVDVQGNHDRARYGESRNWLQTLANQGFLTYLDIETTADGPRLQRIEPGKNLGSFVEWAGCRIIGVRYMGASTERLLDDLRPRLEELKDDQFTILVLHAGLEGQVPNFNAELSATALEQLRGAADYVALGHIHKHYAVGNFAFNGGSLETWNVSEWEWDRGLLHVEIDTDRSPVVSVRLVDVPRRPFCTMRLDVSGYESPRALLHGCFDLIQTQASRNWTERPVVVLRLNGRLRFDAADLPVNQLEDACKEFLDPLVAMVREQYDIRDFTNEGWDDGEGGIDREALEQLRGAA